MQSKSSPKEILDQYASAIDQQDQGHADRIPEEFLFTSKVIVLSQETELPTYIHETVLSFQINYDKDQALEFVNQNLEAIGTEYPELTLEDKTEVLAFIRKNRRSSQPVDLKTFLHVALIYKTRDPSKEVWMLSQLQ